MRPLPLLLPFAVALNVAMTAGASAAPRAVELAQPPRTVAIGGDVAGRAVTSGAGPLQVLFSDGTTITLGRGSAMTIDTYTFDATGNAATLRATLSAGAFRLVGGRAAKVDGGLSLATPFGMLEIRSAAVDLSLVSGEPHFDMLFGTSMRLTRDGRVLAGVRKPGYSIVPDAEGGAAVRMTPAAWRHSMQATLSQAHADADAFAASRPRPKSTHAPTPQAGRSIP